MYLSMFLRVAGLLLGTRNIAKIARYLDKTKRQNKNGNECIYLGDVCITEDMCTKKKTQKST